MDFGFRIPKIRGFRILDFRISGAGKRGRLPPVIYLSTPSDLLTEFGDSGRDVHQDRAAVKNLTPTRAGGTAADILGTKSDRTHV